jgi:hypothetical protein
LLRERSLFDSPESDLSFFYKRHQAGVDRNTSIKEKRERATLKGQPLDSHD